MVIRKCIAVTLVTAFVLCIFLVPMNAFQNPYIKVDMDEVNSISKVVGQITLRKEGETENDESYNLSLSNTNYIGNTFYNGVANGRLYEWRMPISNDSVQYYFDNGYADIEFRIYYNGLTEYYLQGYKMLDFLRMSLKSYFMVNGYAQPCKDYQVFFCNKGVEMQIANYNSIDNILTEIELSVDTDIEIDPMCYVKIKQRVPTSQLWGYGAIYFRVNLMFNRNYMELYNPSYVDSNDEQEAESGREELDESISNAESNADSVLDELGKNTAPSIEDITLAPDVFQELEEVDDFYDKDSTFYTTLIMLAVSSLGIALVGYVLHGKR